MPKETSHSLETPLGAIPYVLRRSSRRRTMELSIPLSTSARVIAPYGVSLEAIERFISSRSEWVLNHLKEKRQQEEKLTGKKYETGHQFLYLGKAYPLIITREDRLLTKMTFQQTFWDVRAPHVTGEGVIKHKLASWYRREAGEVFASRVFHYSRIMGLDNQGQTPRKITVKTQKRLWGSCNHHGLSINLNWTLIMAPLEVIDYVIVHELCHIIVPNHSAKFWRHVQKFMPDYKTQEKWLKENVGEMKLP